MNTLKTDWLVLIAVICFTLAVIVGGSQLLKREPMQYGQKTGELINGKRANLECKVIGVAPWVGFECKADRWGRFLVWWQDEFGQAHMIRDFNYAKEVGDLFSNSPGRLVVTFMDADGYTAEVEIVFSGFSNRECTRDNGCVAV